MAAPRIGHLHAVLQIFAYLNSHDRSRLVFDVKEFDHKAARVADWSGYYPHVKEAIPPNAPKPLGKEMQMTSYIDTDHVGDIVMRRSRTGILLFLNRSPIMWQSKKQASIETSTFGSEFMALKATVEMIKGLRYKVITENVPKTLSKAPWLVAKRMSLTLHLLLFEQSM